MGGVKVTSGNVSCLKTVRLSGKCIKSTCSMSMRGVMVTREV